MFGLNCAQIHALEGAFIPHRLLRLRPIFHVVGPGMHLERAFAHILDCGGMRRANLRGLQNLNKRFQLAAAFYNLSQLMRKLFGIETPKQWAVTWRAGLLVLMRLFQVELQHLRLSNGPKPEIQENFCEEPVILTSYGISVEFMEYRPSSTGCQARTSACN